jgi:TetR/AcrR family transcriptional regulator
MGSRRRLGQKNSATRAAIVDAAAKVMLAEGATALTSRRISQKAGIKSQLVHYYFRTMEELMITLMQREGDEVLKSLARAAASDKPLQALWKLELESRSSALIAGLLALAKHHERVRAEATRYAELGRGMEAEAIARHLELLRIEPSIPPIAIAFVMSAVARQIVDERARGMSLGHREVALAVENWLREITAKSRREPKMKSSKGVSRAARARPRPEA